MRDSAGATRRIVMAGGAAGLAAVACYLLVIVGGFLPRGLRDLVGIAIGPLAVAGFVGLYEALRVHRDGPSARIGALFGVIGGVVMNVYTVVQKGNLQWHLAALERAEGAAEEAAARSLYLAVDRVQGAMDVSFDIFVLVGIALLALAMLSHPKFGSWLAASGALLAAATLILNLWTFPTPPDQAGLIDLGPLVGLWLAVVFGRTVMVADWAEERVP